MNDLSGEGAVLPKPVEQGAYERLLGNYPEIKQGSLQKLRAYESVILYRKCI